MIYFNLNLKIKYLVIIMELNKYIETRKISDKTITNYHNQYNRITELLNTTNTRNIDDDTIIKAIETIDKPNTQRDLITLIILIKEAHNIDTNKLTKYKQNVIYKKINSYNNQKKEILKKNLPTQDELINYLNGLYETHKWCEYIVNYLIYFFNVRNKDIDLFITDKRDKITKGKNYLYLTNDKIIYLRQDYKTQKHYGDKYNEINDKKFINAVKKYGLNKYLLNTLEGDRIAETSLNKKVSNMTFEKLGVNKIFKAILQDKNNIIDYKNISENRGTAINTLLEYYDTKF